MTLRATIVIVTRNRREELHRALQSCQEQSGSPEVLVIDDASTDGSSAMVAREFPAFHLVSDTSSRGYIVQRNRAARIAGGEFLISIDDDAEFSSPTIVEEILEGFTDQPTIGAVAIPYTDAPSHRRLFQQAPDRDACWITGQFVGTAYAVRRDLFLRLGAFDESLVHQGEERDFCLRMLAGGYYVRLGNSAPVRHHRSPKRDLKRMAYYGRRNDIRFLWRHVPMPQAVIRLAGTMASGLARGLRDGMFAPTIRGICAGLVGCISGVPRAAVPRACYALHRRLRSGEAVPFSSLT